MILCLHCHSWWTRASAKTRTGCWPRDSQREEMGAPSRVTRRKYTERTSGIALNAVNIDKTEGSNVLMQ